MLIGQLIMLIIIFFCKVFYFNIYNIVKANIAIDNINIKIKMHIN